MRRMGQSFFDRHYRLVAWGMALAVSFLMLHALELKISPILLSAAQAQGTNQMQQLINQQVALCLEKSDGEFTQIERDHNGRILSVGLNVGKANLLKTQLSENLSESFSHLSQEKLNIPLGNLIGGMWLNGRGPRVSFYLEPYGLVRVDFLQEFSQAGINQTVYRVQLRVQAQMVLRAGKKQTLPTVDTTFLLEERMIAGEVPSVYPWVQNKS